MGLNRRFLEAILDVYLAIVLDDGERGNLAVSSWVPPTCQPPGRRAHIN